MTFHSFAHAASRAAALAAAMTALGAPKSAFAQPNSQPSSVLEDVIIVTASRQSMPQETILAPDAAPLIGHDISHLAARIPGGARIGNGEISGQMQYRGLFGERLNLRVDGQRFASGGPNLMDPVFHYAPESLIAALVIDRGLSPVSKGPGLAGGANAVFKRIGFADDSALKTGYDLSFGARSVNESYSGGGVFGAATDIWRINVLGAMETGGETKYPGGTIAGTQFERGVYGLSAGVKSGFGELGLDLRRQNTGASGNAPFPMDIRYFDSDFARMHYKADVNGAVIEAKLGYSDVAHAMNNYDLRPAPAPGGARETLASAKTWNGAVSIGADRFGGRLELGLDTQKSTHNVRITNPNRAQFFVTPFPDITISRFGGFAQWTGAFGPVNSELGGRIDEYAYKAGPAMLGPVLPMGPQNLARAFNQADRGRTDTAYDLMGRFWTNERNGIVWRASLAHKENMPGYIQRYGWLPISASGGLADGNIYVGDLSLEKETAWIAEAGFDYRSARAYFRSTVYLRQIDNYIQGAPFDDTPGIVNTPAEMVASMNGDAALLKWANVDARLYGLDFDAGFDFEGPLRFDTVFNYVKGERRDIDDNLYRIPPPSLLAALTWEQPKWAASFEMRALMQQESVSARNSEVPSDGYAVFSAALRREIGAGIDITIGAENLLDTKYRDHLSGINRNGFGDAPLGERIPGAGRGAFIRLHMTR